MGKIQKYQKEYPVKDEKGTNRKYDMYFVALSGEEYLIEMDGGYGHGDIVRKHKNKKFLPAKLFYADTMKSLLAEDMGIPLVRIDCYKSEFSYIKNHIMNSIIPEVVDLSEVDWLKVEDICFRSLIADVCTYKKAHPECSASEITDQFGIFTTTIRKYWKIGTELELCEYDPEKDFER